MPSGGRSIRSRRTISIKGVDGDKPFHAIFIRAPLIESVGAGVDVLARVEKDNQEVIVAAQQGNLLVTSFHPELSNDDRFHRYFLKMAESKTRYRRKTTLGFSRFTFHASL